MAVLCGYCILLAIAFVVITFSIVWWGRVRQSLYLIIHLHKKLSNCRYILLLLLYWFFIVAQSSIHSSEACRFVSSALQCTTGFKLQRKSLYQLRHLWHIHMMSYWCRFYLCDQHQTPILLFRNSHRSEWILWKQYRSCCATLFL